MSKKISKIEFPNVSETNEQTSADVQKGLKGDMLASEELSDVEGGFCDYTCIACSSSGLISF
jgi:hypothetical protein